MAVRLFAEPFFYFCGGRAFLLGVFEKMSDFAWCFCGEVVVVEC
jgi:hypothetical protein